MKEIVLTEIAGCDIGNGYVKALLQCGDVQEMISMPSASVRKAVQVPEDIEAENAIDSLEDNLAVSVTSPLLKQEDSTPIMIGQRALDSGEETTVFNISGKVKKCDQALSAQLLLSVVAEAAFKEAWLSRDEDESMPDLIKVDCYLSCGLPIADYLECHAAYRKNLMTGTHEVQILNFGKPYVVAIRFVEVKIMAEGEACHYAVSKMGESLFEAVIEELQEEDLYSADDIEEIQDLVDEKEYNSIIGIDIGEGTVNLPVIKNGKFNPEASRTLNEGIGEVLDRVVSRQKNEHDREFDNRKDLAAHILSLQKKKAKKKKEALNVIMEDTAWVSKEFIDDICSAFSTVFMKSGKDADAVFLYGGGSYLIWKMLLPKLREIVKPINDVPVIFLPATYSRYLNRNGFFFKAKELNGE